MPREPVPKGSKSRPAPASIASLSAPAEIGDRRRLWYRLTAAILVPLLLLALLELAFRLLGVGYSTSYFLSTQVKGKAVLVENQRFCWRFFPPSIARRPPPCLLSADKAAGAVRVFVLGESAAMGDPEPAFGFSRVLEALLRERHPGVPLQVVNVGVTAISSTVVLEIARDCARRGQGDAWVVYMGNNEVVGPYGAGTVFGAQAPGRWWIRLTVGLKGTRLGQLASGLAERLGRGGKGPRSWGGMQMFLEQQVGRQDPRMARVYGNFQANLEEIVRLGRKSGAQVLVSTVAGNVKDCAPFASRHRAGLGGGELAEWEREYRAGNELAERGDDRGAVGHYERAAVLDGAYADGLYRLGGCYGRLGRWEDAKGWYERALEEDALRFRPDRRINEIIRAVAGRVGESGVRLVGGAEALGKASPHGLVGDEMLYEHVHMTWEGNYELGRLLAGEVEAALGEKLGGERPGTNGWLSVEGCARRLAFTEWDRYQGVEQMWKRMQEPPFTLQSDRAARGRRWQKQRESLSLLVKNNKLTNIVNEYSERLRVVANDWYLNANYGLLLQETGDVEGAIRQWQRVLELLPHHLVARYRLASLYDKTQRWPEAEAIYREALRMDPFNLEALCGLGLVLFHEGQPDAARRYYREALRIDPGCGEAYCELAEVSEKAGQTEVAVAEYEKALQRKPNLVFAHLSLGRIWAGQQQWEKSLGHYQLAVRLAPDDAMAHYNLANIYGQLGQMDKAVAAYEEALRWQPAFSECHVNLGLELVKLGRLSDAASHYEEALRLKPSAALAHFNLGKLLSRQGQSNEALAHYAEAVKYMPDFADAHLSLGALLGQQKRWDEALAHFEEALRINPGHELARKYRAEVLRLRAQTP